MSDPEIDAIRAILAASPRPSGLAERRERLDDLGKHYRTPAEFRLEPVDANGVAGGMVHLAGSRSFARDPVPARRRIHLGIDRKSPAAGDRHRTRRGRTHARARLSPGAGASIPRCGGGCDFRLSLPARTGPRPRPHRDRRRQRRRRSYHRIDGCSARQRAAAAVMRLVHLAMGRSREYGGDDVDQGGGRSADPEALSHGARQQLSRRASPRTPLASPLFADLTGLPPVLIQVGSAETLLDDSVRLAGALGCADVAVTLEVWPDMIHAFPLFHRAGRGGASCHRAGGRVHQVRPGRRRAGLMQRRVRRRNDRTARLTSAGRRNSASRRNPKYPGRRLSLRPRPGSPSPSARRRA